jgi:hypothetical protein
MSIRIGYLLPTRERIMAEQPQAAPLLELAERAERLGFVLSRPVYQRNRRPQGGTGRLQGDAGRSSVSRMATDKTQRVELPRLPPRRAELKSGQRYLL